jgi:hypothetical protein
MLVFVALSERIIKNPCTAEKVISLSRIDQQGKIAAKYASQNLPTRQMVPKKKHSQKPLASSFSTYSNDNF